jgi:hypothetical protein
MTDLSPAERSLLRATRLLWAAAEQADQPTASTGDLERVLLQGAVRGLVWQAMVLLPEGLPLFGATPARSGCLGILEEAEQELRARPIGEYPVGTSALVIAVCDTIATTRAGQWL